MKQNVAGNWRMGGQSLANARYLQFEWVRLLHEGLLISNIIYGSKTMVWREKERSRNMAIQMDNHRGLVGIWRKYRILNTRARKLFGRKKGWMKGWAY